VFANKIRPICRVYCKKLCENWQSRGRTRNNSANLPSWHPSWESLPPYTLKCEMFLRLKNYSTVLNWHQVAISCLI